MMPCTYRRLEAKAEAEICWFFLEDSDGNSDLSERKRKQPCRGERGENPPLVARTRLRNNLGKWKHRRRMLLVLFSETSKPLPRSPIGTLVQNSARSLLHIAKDRNRDALKSPNKKKKKRVRTRRWKAVPVWLPCVRLVFPDSLLRKTGVLHGSLKPTKFLQGTGAEGVLCFLPSQRTRDGEGRLPACSLSHLQTSGAWNAYPERTGKCRGKPPEWEQLSCGCLTHVWEKLRRNSGQIQTRGTLGASCWRVRSRHPAAALCPY